MRSYFTNDEIDKIGESLVKQYDYQRYISGQAFNIDDFVYNFLGYSIIYEDFAENDLGKIAFVSDGKTPLKVKRNGKIVSITPKIKSIILDNNLREKENKRRFTLAHEVGHIILNRLTGEGTSTFFNLVKNNCVDFDLEMLKNALNVIEFEATQIGVAMLLPKDLVTYLFNKISKGKIFIYGEEVVTPKDKIVIEKIATRLKVSYQCMFIRLKNLNLFEYRTMDEFLSDIFEKEGKIV